MTKEAFVQGEKYLKLNDEGHFVADYQGEYPIIDCHTHMSSVLPMKFVNPSTKGKILKYDTLPPIEEMDLSIPYWTKVKDVREKGLLPIIRSSLDGYRILKDMAAGGTYDNCFKSQQENGIIRNVVLPLSTKSCDRSMESLALVKEHPNRFTAFCSVSPFDKRMREKISRYKALGFKGLKLKITELELKKGVEPLVELFQACYQAGFPVLLHTGASHHIKRENTSKLMWKLLQSTRVELFGELLGRLPKDFTFIFGHSGIGEYRLVAEYMKAFPSSYAEISCQSAESISYLIATVGYERILFGSDWPALPQGITLSRVLLATEGHEEARAHILYKNAQKLLGL